MSTLHDSSFISRAAARALRRPAGPSHVACVAIALLLSPAACGKDDEAPQTPSTAGTTAGASGDSPGSSGSNASAAGAAGTASVPPPQPVSCGSSTCNPPTNPLSGLLASFGGGAIAGLPTPVACCLDESAGKCGVAMTAGAACEAPAVADSRCPGISAGGLGALGGSASMVGCCIDNACGQDGSLFGRGCVENSQARGMISAIPLVGTLLSIPPSRACDAPPTTPDSDAGVEDAGI